MLTATNLTFNGKSIWIAEVEGYQPVKKGGLKTVSNHFKVKFSVEGAPSQRLKEKFDGENVRH